MLKTEQQVTREELTRAPELSELDFGWWRIHIKIDWRPKGWDEAEFQVRLSRWWG